MSKLSLSDFKQHKALIVVTILLGVEYTFGSFYITEFSEYTELEAFVASLIILPIEAWWLYAFWNAFLTKICKAPEISFGLAFFLTAALMLFFNL